MRTKRPITVFGVLLAILSMLVAGCGGTTSSTNGRTQVQIGYAAISADQSPAWVAKDKGIFAKNGLDVTLQSIAGGSSPTSALASGQIQALQISMEAISARLEGADILYTAAPVSLPPFWLVSQPSISTASDLKGKKVAVTGTGTATYYAAIVALRSLGLDPLKDVTFISVNNVPAIFTAVKSGQVQAGALSMPTFAQVPKAGLHVLTNVATLGVRYPTSWLAVQGSYLKDHRNVVAAVVRSITEAIAFELQQPAETMKIIGRYSKLTDSSILKTTYDDLAPRLNRTPAPKASEVADALNLVALSNRKAATANPAQFVDSSLVDQLQQQGFINNLYAGHS